jgi:fumarate hydratase subunit beta
MDPYAPALLEHGVRGMIGKGRRSAAVKDAIRRFGAVYFAAVEGTAALLGRCVRSAEVVAFPDLGAEAVYRLTVDRFPVVVANDCHGGDAYEDGRAKFRR